LRNGPQDPAKNAPFWHASKSPRLPLPKNLFKTQVVDELFYLFCDHKIFWCDHMSHVFALTGAVFMIYEHVPA